MFFRILFVLFLSLPSFAAQSQRYIVAGADLSGLKREVAREGGRWEQDLQFHSAFVAELSDRAAQKIQQRFGAAALIEPDAEFTALGRKVAEGKPGGGTVAQPQHSIPWGISAIHAPEAHSLSRGAGFSVCIVDTGIQPDHPDLATNVVGGRNFTYGKGFRVDPNAWHDENGHGTHVAGTVAAVNNTIGVVGVAPDARLLSARVLDRNGSGYASAVADGIRWCASTGARVINMSLGSASDSSLIRLAVTDAAAIGVILVAAAGNESAGVSYPAKYSEVLAVTAVNSSLGFASFSNFGAEVDYAAPGVSVLSTTKGSGYATYSGTSMASPHVAGVVALMLSSGSFGLVADDIGLSVEQQGNGFIQALKTVMNR